jgi:hypothetical protein
MKIEEIIIYVGLAALFIITLVIMPLIVEIRVELRKTLK